MDDTRPKVYLASKLYRANLWRYWQERFPLLHVVSTWHNNLHVELDDMNPHAALSGWEQNIADLRSADHLLAFAEAVDKPNGTLVEIGIAIASGIPVHLVGNYPWGSWQYLPLVETYPTLREARLAILECPANVIEFKRSITHDATKG